MADDWDGVHLSCLAYLTADGTTADLNDGDITMLRNWGSERTAWLNPALAIPKPLPVPEPLADRTRSVDSPVWPIEQQWLTNTLRR